MFRQSACKHLLLVLDILVHDVTATSSSASASAPLSEKVIRCPCFDFFLWCAAPLLDRIVAPSLPVCTPKHEMLHHFLSELHDNMQSLRARQVQQTAPDRIFSISVGEGPEVWTAPALCVSIWYCYLVLLALQDWEKILEKL